MRRTTIILLAAALALAGCSTNSPHGSKPALKPSPSKTLSLGEQYLQTAHGINFNGSPTDVELLVYPTEWCKQLDAGHSVTWLFSMSGGGLYPNGDQWGTDEADADTLLVAGVKAFCPANLSDVKEQLRAAGNY
jgi:hypothetical protein